MLAAAPNVNVAVDGAVVLLAGTAALVDSDAEGAAAVPAPKEKTGGLSTEAGGLSTESADVFFRIPRVELSAGFWGEDTLAPKLNVDSVGLLLSLSGSVGRLVDAALSVLVRSGRLEPGDVT